MKGSMTIPIVAILAIAAIAGGLYFGGFLPLSIPSGYIYIDTWTDYVNDRDVVCDATLYQQCYFTKTFDSNIGNKEGYIDAGDPIGYGSCSACTVKLYGLPIPSGPTPITIAIEAEDGYGINTAFSMTAQISGIEDNYPVNALILETGSAAQVVPLGNGRWQFYFNPITSTGEYTARIFLTDPEDGTQISKTETFFIRQPLEIQLGVSDFTQYTTKDIILELKVIPNVQIYRPALQVQVNGVNVNSYFLLSDRTGGNYQLIIPAGQIALTGNMKFTVSVQDTSGTYDPQTATLSGITYRQPTLDVDISMTDNTAVNVGDVRTIVIETSGLSNQEVEPEWVRLEVEYSGQVIKTYQTNEFMHTAGTGRYEIQYQFIAGQQHYFYASASKTGFLSNPGQMNVPVSGGSINPTCGDRICSVGEDATTCPSDCEQPEFQITWVLVVMIIFTFAGLYGLFKMVSR